MVGLWRWWRRRRLLARPFPQGWETYLEELPFSDRLGEADGVRWRDIVRVLVAEKSWEGCAGLVVTERMKVLIAGGAALLILRIPHDYFRRVMTVLIYPDTYVVPDRHDASGEADVGPWARSGEAWPQGPVVLSWADVERGLAQDPPRSNVVLHEFAHKLDMQNGLADGTPPLAGRRSYAAWEQMMKREYAELRAALEAGERTPLDPYAATNFAEFFAVATETFFLRPSELRRERPELYRRLAEYYAQDPASRPPGRYTRGE